jgi:hypothetical protein
MRILRLGALLLSLLFATPTYAAMVTWVDSGLINAVSPQWGPLLLPGLTVGTPWSLQVSFDPNGPFTPGLFSTPASPCNIYNTGPTTFTLGSYTYTNPGGRIWTNAILPHVGCFSPANGAIVFEYGYTAPWTQEPGAWNLSYGLLFYQYVDTAHNDGTLPDVPSAPGIDGPSTAFAPGLTFYTADSHIFPIFQGYPVSPTAVPEPSTVAMFSVGLAYGARRLRQREEFRERRLRAERGQPDRTRHGISAQLSRVGTNQDVT